MQSGYYHTCLKRGVTCVGGWCDWGKRLGGFVDFKNNVTHIRPQ